MKGSHHALAPIKLLFFVVFFANLLCLTTAKRTVRGKAEIGPALDDNSVQITAEDQSRLSGNVIVRRGEMILCLKVVSSDSPSSAGPSTKRNILVSPKTFNLLFPNAEIGAQDFSFSFSPSVHWLHFDGEFVAQHQMPLGIVEQLPRVDFPNYTPAWPFQWQKEEKDSDYVAILKTNSHFESFLFPFFCVLVDGIFGSVSVRIVGVQQVYTEAGEEEGIFLSPLAFQKVALTFPGAKVVWKIAPCPRTAHGPVDTPPPMDRRGIGQLDPLLPGEDLAYFASVSSAHMIKGVPNDVAHNPLLHPNACIRLYVPQNGREMMLKIGAGDPSALSESDDIGLSHAAYAKLIGNDIDVLVVEWNFIPCDSTWSPKKRSWSSSCSSCNEENCFDCAARSNKRQVVWADDEITGADNDGFEYYEPPSDTIMQSESIDNFSLSSSLDIEGLAFAFPLEVSTEGIINCESLGFPRGSLTSEMALMENMIALPLQSDSPYDHKKLCSFNNLIKIEGPSASITARFVGFFQGESSHQVMLSTKAFQLISGGSSGGSECKIRWSLATQPPAVAEDSLVAIAHPSPIFQGCSMTHGFCGPTVPFSRWEWVIASVPLRFLQGNWEFLCGSRGFLEVTHIASGRKLTLKVADVMIASGDENSNDIGLSAKACALLLGTEDKGAGNGQPFAVKWKFVTI